MKIIKNREQLKVDDELVGICRRIASEQRDDDGWSEIESCDMFQSEHYCGGYDSIEQLFCFSYYAEDGKEWWFHFQLHDVKNMIDGPLQYLDLYEPS